MILLFVFHLGKEIPLFKDLVQQFTPRYGRDWKVIGTVLDIHFTLLEMIEKNFNGNTASCCNAMLEEWLKRDVFASWEKLFNAVESCTSSSAHSKGDYNQ